MNEKCEHCSLIAFLVFLVLTANLFSGCSSKRVISKNSYRQHFVDVTRKYFPDVSGPVQQAVFAYLNRDSKRDLLLLTGGSKRSRSRILVLINRDRGRFDISEESGTLRTMTGNFRFISAGDLDGDRVDDLVLITEESGKSSAKILFNNKKGYFYFKPNQVYPSVFPGMDRVALIDLDQDGDRDLFFTGVKVRGPDGRPHRFQAQLMINNGRGEFQDLTKMLMPTLPPGIRATSFADYDGDGSQDVFLVYAEGRNRLLFNNGLGQFRDQTLNYLPGLPGESIHADWADFDLDGDNDLLVVNRISRRGNRSGTGETCYFLENDGRGRFHKRSHKVLPRSPSFRVYLLDANGTDIPDALILSADGTHFLHGKGKWKFSVETERRLPRNRKFQEMTFGDVNDDGYLDLFAIDQNTGKGRLWLNVFK